MLAYRGRLIPRGYAAGGGGLDTTSRDQLPGTCAMEKQQVASSQRSPIFRLLLKVAVNGTHQCDFINF